MLSVFRSQSIEEVAFVPDQTKRARGKISFGIPTEINKSVAPLVASLIHVLFEPEFVAFDWFRGLFKDEELMIFDVPAGSDNQRL